MDDKGAAVQRALLERRLTIGCAESVTGGELAARLSATPGASATFVGGIISYATQVKRSVLGVTAEQVVSGECAREMARGARTVLGCDWAISTTGVAGPDEQEGEPVGTVFVGLAGPTGVRAIRHTLAGGRAEIRAAACEAALDEALRALRVLRP